MSNQSLVLPTPGIEKMPTGIDGFDEITGGGLPRKRTTLLMGTPGSGKTVFALQMLINGARQWGEPGIFVAFEENSRQLIQNASTFGWDLSNLEQERLFCLDARMSPEVIQAGDFDLLGMLASLKAKAEEMGAKRIVFDSIDVLLAFLDNRLTERRELYRIHDWLAESGLTGIITARSEGAEPSITHRYDYLQFMADCVVLLQHKVEARISMRELRVVKYRGSGFAESSFPLTITTNGIEVFGTTRIEPEYQVFTERVSTGVERLDAMLQGGYFRGTVVLLTGLGGTAKTTLSGAFVDAACRRGETTLLVSFDESSGEMVRNLASVGIDLQKHLDSGVLQMYWSRREAQSAEEHLITLRRLIKKQQPRHLIIDPLSTMLQSSSALNAAGIMQRLIVLTKAAGITSIFTSSLAGTGENIEATPYHISTLADTWIHLSYVAQGGERNRALTVIKSRGTHHSNQVRELILSENGITLQDVYVSDGEVLMGTLRYERETAQQFERERVRIEVEKQRRELELAEAEISARIQVFEGDLETKRIALQALEVEHAKKEIEWTNREQNMRRLRGADLIQSADKSGGKETSTGTTLEQKATGFDDERLT